MTRNKENLNRWAREYYHKRKTEKDYVERRKKSARKYYHTHKKQCLESRKRYFEAHKEAYRKYRREWRYNTPAGIYGTIKGSIRNKNQHFLKITMKEFIDWYNSQGKICFYCKRTYEQSLSDPLNKRVNRLTIDRIDNSRGYENGNLTLACLRCNAIKNNYFTKDEMLKIGEIIRDKNAR